MNNVKKKCWEACVGESPGGTQVPNIQKKEGTFKI